MSSMCWFKLNQSRCKVKLKYYWKSKIIEVVAMPPRFNTIYAYKFHDVNGDEGLKIGKACRNADTAFEAALIRIKEQHQSAGQRDKRTILNNDPQQIVRRVWDLDELSSSGDPDTGDPWNDNNTRTFEDKVHEHEDLHPHMIMDRRRKTEEFLITDVDLVNRIIRELLGLEGTQSLAEFERPHQYWVRAKVNDIYGAATETPFIGLYLAPRFGKTLNVLAIWRNLGHKIGIVEAHWLSALTSFEKTAQGKRDVTDDITYIRIKQDNVAEALETAQKVLDAGRRVLFGISMHFTGKDPDISHLPPIQEFITENGGCTMYVDEADHGAHTERSRNAIDNILPEVSTGIKSCVLLGTGTSIGRALAPYREHIKSEPITVSYIDMLKAKRGEGFLFSEDFEGEGDEEKKALEEMRAKKVTFKNRLQWLPDVHQLQMTMPEDLVNEITKNLEKTPSWARIHGSTANSASLTAIFERLLNEDDNDQMCLKPKMKHIDEEMGYSHEYDFMTVMAFGSGTKNSIGRMKKAILDSKYLNENFAVEVLISDPKDNASNETAEAKIKKSILKAEKENKKGLIILSLGMGSRSFSIGEMQAVIEMYDSGNINTAKQKQSRALTPYPYKEAGFVVTLSFDPNRLDDFEMGILDEASRQHADGKGKAAMNETIQEVYRVVTLWRFSEMGTPQLVEVDSLMKKALDKPRELCRLIGAMADPRAALADPDLAQALGMIAGNTKSGVSLSDLDKIDRLLPKVMTRTSGSSEEDDSGMEADKVDKDEEALLHSVMKKALEQLSRLPLILGRYFDEGEASTFLEAIQKCEEDEKLSEDFEALVGITPEVLLSLKDALWKQTGHFLDIAYTFKEVQTP